MNVSGISRRLSTSKKSVLVTQESGSELRLIDTLLKIGVGIGFDSLFQNSANIEQKYDTTVLYYPLVTSYFVL